MLTAAGYIFGVTGCLFDSAGYCIPWVVYNRVYVNSGGLYFVYDTTGVFVSTTAGSFYTGGLSSSSSFCFVGSFPE